MAETPRADDLPLLLRVEEAARVCGISRSIMYELIASGDVPSIKIGASRRIPTDRLRLWIAARTTAKATT